jgi:hypothetical protein
MNSAGKSNEHHRRMPVSPLATHRMVRVESQFQRLFKATVGRTNRESSLLPNPIPLTDGTAMPSDGGRSYPVAGLAMVERPA